MAARRQSEQTQRKGRPATTPEGRENQLTAMAMNLAERQMLEGTASSQVMTHFLKMGSTREQLERERLQRENDLLRAKAEAMEGAKEVQALYQQALSAMREYSGQEPLDYDFDDEL